MHGIFVPHRMPGYYLVLMFAMKKDIHKMTNDITTRVPPKGKA